MTTAPRQLRRRLGELRRGNRFYASLDSLTLVTLKNAGIADRYDGRHQLPGAPT
jgi:hypothetical protein